MEMIRKAKRKLNSTNRLRLLCYFCVIVVGFAILEIAFEVFYVRGGLGNNKVHMYVYSIASRHMPIHYWRDRQKHPENYKESKTPPTCSSIPHPGDIMFATPYWQRLVADSYSAYLYTAYWEQTPQPTISVILLSTGRPDNLYCKLWFLNEVGPSQVRAETRLLIDSKTESGVSEVQTAYTVNCKLDGKHIHKPPVAVSLVKQPQCKKIDNVLAVINIPIKDPGDLSLGFYKPPPLLPFMNDISIGVCVIWPDEEDDNTDLVAHWFEILRMVGVHRIYMSINKAHRRVHDLIHFYEEHGLVLKLAKSRPLSANNLLALTPELRVRYDSTFRTLIYTDCLYQARGLHQYMLMLRPFEVVMPLEDDDHWQHLIKKNSKKDNLADALVVDRWNEAGDESKEFQDMAEDRPYRSFQRTDSVTVAKLWGPETCTNKEGNPRKCKQRTINKGAKFLPYIAVKECTRVSNVRKIPNSIETACVYRPHEMLVTLWWFVDSIANTAVNSLY